MVRPGFAGGLVISSIEIKGLAEIPRLWRAV
jgi:hypothetical protein